MRVLQTQTNAWRWAKKTPTALWEQLEPYLASMSRTQTAPIREAVFDSTNVLNKVDDAFQTELMKAAGLSAVLRGFLAGYHAWNSHAALKAAWEVVGHGEEYQQSLQTQVGSVEEWLRPEGLFGECKIHTLRDRATEEIDAFDKLIRQSPDIEKKLREHRDIGAWNFGQGLFGTVQNGLSTVVAWGIKGKWGLVLKVVNLAATAFEGVATVQGARQLYVTQEQLWEIAKFVAKAEKSRDHLKTLLADKSHCEGK